ncbi:DUF805 domain-containing protein [Hymenobacter weizhouensis]|uniref:DUF805 domain-containing protein n=1 Tax=Hymenobacter sp. YIM 151500-1 TaxID=2987689 RepID=UPI00222704E2|nr:DUF805 domain-containing protein [Hymenobacter sp. YIM 151500-1]UYZ65067.1 DUF805 domain-containing protein [Hymenobacter sp. YIM 151500-1]
MIQLYSLVRGRQGRVAFALEIFPVLLPLVLLYALTPTGQLPPVLLASGLWLVSTALVAGLAVRRLHDIGRSGFYAILLITPVLNWALLVALLLLPSRPRAVRQRRVSTPIQMPVWRVAAAA